jgi:hypothetical protein
MPKIEITINSDGLATKRFQEFTTEDPACDFNVKLNGVLKDYGVILTQEKENEKVHGHTHSHVHMEG